MTDAAQDHGLSVPAHELGVLRLFALDPDAPTLAALRPPHQLEAGQLAPLLGLSTLREGQAERFAINDLGDFTLTEFLRIAHDIRSDELAPHQPLLDSLKGHVLALHSPAFSGAATRLTPAPGLRFLGAFRRNDAPPAPLSLPATEKDETLSPPLSAPSRRGSGLAILTALALLLALGLALLLWGKA